MLRDEKLAGTKGDPDLFSIGLVTHMAVPSAWDRYRLPAVLNPRRVSYGHYFFSPLEKFYEKQLSRLPGPFSRALDIGCGNGQQLLHLISERAVTFGVGVDASAGAVEGALTLATTLGIDDDRARFQNCSFEGFLDSSIFDLVIATQFINYVPSADTFFARVDLLTQASACLIVSDVQKEVRSWTQVLKTSPSIRKAFRKPPLETDDLYRHTYDEVVASARKYGFEEVFSAFGLGLMPRLFGTWMHRVSLKEFEGQAQRRAAKLLYVCIRRLWILEDALRSATGKGALYWILFRKGAPERVE